MNWEEFREKYNFISEEHNRLDDDARKLNCVFACYWEITELIRFKRRLKESYRRDVKNINDIIKNKSRHLNSLLREDSVINSFEYLKAKNEQEDDTNRNLSKS